MIDAGIDVLHEAFRDAAGKTRIVAVWDQWGVGGRAPEGFGFGTEHGQAEIDGYLERLAADPSFVPPGLGRDRRGHGTHVASIAAGRAAGAFAGGMAPEARIVVVVSATSGSPDDPRSMGYSRSHVSALAYIDRIATRLGLPVVVNVSQGQNAGAHDGHSLLEAAFDEFSKGGREPGRVLVKSAGNEREFAGHARVAVKGKRLVRFESLVDARDRRSERFVIEGWFNACDELEIRLLDPTGAPTGAVSPASPTASGKLPSGDGFILTYTRFHHDNGDSRFLATVYAADFAGVAAGEWTIEVTGRSVRSDGEMNFWLERDGRRLVRFKTDASAEMTLSIPGTARTVIAVASIDANDPFTIASYSSVGPTRDRRRKPDLAAPGDAISAADGGTAAGARPESGTSMAAPHVTGAVALLLSRRAGRMRADPKLKQLNAAQVRSALTQTARGFNGSWNPEAGYGALDAEALLAAFG